MASIGKLAGSLVSATNENTLALLNVKVDFSVFRRDPPREYAPVGLALTDARKQEAENGSLHATACKLGFLFYELLPDTPKIIKAYGTRISEILSRPDISPEGTENDGPFRAFVGADCTSIWAAATCGPASVSVLLLACMLSRAWDTKAATSIWVELVEERRRQIETQIRDNRIVHPHSMAAAREMIGRAELADWDASARSWLRRADLFMALNHTQFRLVVDNLAIPYSSTGSTFEKVTMAWIRSMEVVEKLLGNLPQQASDRAVLLAVSSWHLYPDLLVFQREAKKIPFKDALFPSAGILSLGLEYKGPSDNVAQWSLALSHLRYYGDPVRVHSRDDLSRVRIDQFWLVVLGAVFRQWGVSNGNFDTAVGWFQDMHDILSSQGADARSPHLSWIVKLCSAAATVDPAANMAANISLIRYGWRRGGKLFGGEDKPMHSPFFGLCNPHVMDAMTKATDVDCGIAYLRGLASQLGLEVHEAVISYTGNLDHETPYTEWATIAPIEPLLGRCPGDAGSDHVLNTSTKKNVRWACLHQRGRTTAQSTILEKRRREIDAAEEVCCVTNEDQMPMKRGDTTHYRWDRPPRVFGEASFVDFRCPNSLRGDWHVAFRLYFRSEQFSSKMAYCFDQIKRAAATVAPLQQGRHFLKYRFPPRRVVQYLKESLNAGTEHRTQVVTSDISSRFKRKAPMDEVMPEENHSTTKLLLGHHPGGQSRIQNDITGAFCLMTGVCHRSKHWLVPLRALEVAQGLYEQLPGATVSVRLIEQDLLKAKWLPPPIRSILDNKSPLDSFTAAAETPVSVFLEAMTRAASFACIIMFESGQFNIDPDQLNEVIALCSEDSIFVAGILLTDPGVKKDGACIRHLVGNIGQPGMALMVSPIQPRIRAIDHNPLLVKHGSYDGSATDSFRETSLHLSFTTWKMPLDWHNTGEIDQEIFLLESVVAVQDNGKWVADIDVLELEKNCPDVIEHFNCDQDCMSDIVESHEDLVSIDSWEELLDLPPCTGVLRAKGNWVARLAAAAVLAQQENDNRAVIVGVEKICWRCLESTYAEPEPHMPQLIIF